MGLLRGGGRSGLMIERGIIQKTKSSEVGICAMHWYEEIIVDNNCLLINESDSCQELRFFLVCSVHMCDLPKIFFLFNYLFIT